MQICNCYALGYHAGLNNFSDAANIFKKDTDEYYAWLIGYNVGLQTEFYNHEDGVIH